MQAVVIVVFAIVVAVVGWAGLVWEKRAAQKLARRLRGK